MCIQNKPLKVPPEHKDEILHLLQQQVSAAHICKESAWHLNPSRTKNCSDRDEQLRKLIYNIEEIMDCEKQINQKRMKTGLTPE